MSGDRSRGPASLKDLKRPLRPPADPVLPLEQVERRILGTEGQGSAPQQETATRDPMGAETSAPPTVRPVVPPVVPPPVLPPVIPGSELRPKPRIQRVSWSIKLPLDVHTELSEVAEYNGLNMSEITIEALRRHLPNFPHPPKSR